MHISTNLKVISILLVSIVFKYSTCETVLWRINQRQTLHCEFDNFDEAIASQWYRNNEVLLEYDFVNIQGNISTITFRIVNISVDQSEFSCRHLNIEKCNFKIYLYDDPQNYRGKVIFEIDYPDFIYETSQDPLSNQSFELSSTTPSPHNISLILKDPYNYRINVTYMFEAFPLSQLLIDGNPESAESCESSIGLKCLKTKYSVSSSGLYDSCPAKRLNYSFSYDYGSATEYQNLTNTISFNTNILLQYAPIIELRNIPSEYDVKEEFEPTCHVKCFSSGQDWSFYWHIEQSSNNNLITVDSFTYPNYPSNDRDSELRLNISNNFDRIKIICSVKNGILDGSSYSIDAMTVKKKRDPIPTSTDTSGINLSLGAIIGIAVGIFAVIFILVFVVRYVVLPHFYFINKRI